MNDIAAVTGIPAALLGLIRDADAPRPVARMHQVRRLIAALVVLEVAAIANITLCLLTAVRGNVAQSVFTGLVGAALGVSAFVVARALSPVVGSPVVYWRRRRGPGDEQGCQRPEHGR